MSIQTISLSRSMDRCSRYNLHYQSYNVVSTMITKAIRRHFSKGVPRNETDAFSSKYVCIESIAKIESHQSVDLFKIPYCSCHNIGTNK